jgi:hypothetical protein
VPAASPVPTPGAQDGAALLATSATFKGPTGELILGGKLNDTFGSAIICYRALLEIASIQSLTLFQTEPRKCFLHYTRSALMNLLQRRLM